MAMENSIATELISKLAGLQGEPTAESSGT